MELSLYLRSFGLQILDLVSSSLSGLPQEILVSVNYLTFFLLLFLVDIKMVGLVIIVKLYIYEGS